jgi:hypothetical protein
MLSVIFSWLKRNTVDPFEWVDNNSKYEDTCVFLHKDRMYVPCTCSARNGKHMRMIGIAC